MHVAADINWILQGVVLGVAAALGLVIVARKAASRYFVVDSNFGSSAAADISSMGRGKGESGMGEFGDGAAMGSYSCAVCGLAGKKRCAGCKMVKYCSEDCQTSHWKSEHKNACLKFQSEYKKKSDAMMGIKGLPLSVRILFPYEEFVKFFNWDKLDFPPCGLFNCGNSCFANVVLQCLAYTRPLVVYLLVKGHRTDCRMDDWCFLCELQNHVERSGQSLHPFSPVNMLSRLPNIGGNLGYGKQEDAHEFMRFAIDMMQSVCLDEFGGEKVVLPNYQETTLIQHIFGGRLRSQVICTQCNNISNQFENMMDLTVEIQGDAGSLEECLDQFTAKEKLHGDNMYKCDGCNDYVTAWKRLTVQQAPNILTIALKRFQSGRFGKLNKRVTFPETLDLRPYMSGLEDENDFYRLYAVIVHVDMLNASFFGHYICYIKDFHGNWYRIDDCKVASVELDEVLSQGAYMLLYSRVCARPSCLLPNDNSRKVVSECEGIEEAELQPLRNSTDKCLPDASCHDSLPQCNGHLSLESSSAPVAILTEELPVTSDLLGDKSGVQNMLFSESGSPASVMDTEIDKSMSPSTSEEESVSPMVLDNQMCGGTGTTSLIDETSSPSEVENPVSSSPIQVISNASCGSKTYANGDLMGLLSEEPTNKDCSSNGGDPPYSITSKASQQVDVENSNASSNGVSEGAKKLSGGSSGAKLKPVFQPGFLVKMPQRRSAIRT